MLDLAAAQAAASHDHPDAIAAAQAVALSIFLLRNNVAPRAVRERLTDEFRHDLSPERALSCGGGLDASVAGTVPPALAAAFECPNWDSEYGRPSVSAEMPIRLAALRAPRPNPFTACRTTSPREPAHL